MGICCSLGTGAPLKDSHKNDINEETKSLVQGLFEQYGNNARNEEYKRYRVKICVL